MPTPTLTELFDKIEASIQKNLPTAVVGTGKEYLNAMASMLAGVFKSLYYTFNQVQKNCWPATADRETLVRMGNVYLNRLPFPPTRGEYNVTLVPISPGTITAGTRIKSDDDSSNPDKIFYFARTIEIADINVVAPIQSEDLGTVSALIVGDKLSFINPNAHAADNFAVLSETTKAENGENIEVYRRLVIRSINFPPKGGATSDYIVWASDVPQVRLSLPYLDATQAFVIRIFIEVKTENNEPIGTPEEILDQVGEVIEKDPDDTKTDLDRKRRPLNVTVIPTGIEIVFVDIVFSGVMNIDETKQTQITNAIRLYLYEIRPFIEAANAEVDRNDTVTKNDIIAIVNELKENIEFFSNVEITIESTVRDTYQFLGGKVPKLNPIEFNE